jgi:hypothetical protein
MPERGPPVTATHRPGRPRRRLLALVAGLSIALAGGALGASAQAATVAQQLGALPTIQPFNGEATSRSQFATRWSAFHFAFENLKGSDTARGWKSDNAYPNINGAYYNAASYTAAYGGAAAAVTLVVGPESSSRSFSLWLDATDVESGADSGYELRFTYVGEEEEELVYDVTLTKWVFGVETVLATQEEVTFVEGDALAIVDEGATVSAWTNTGSGFSQLTSARDTTFNSGRVGLSAKDRNTYLTTFKAGQIAPAVPTLTRTNPASPSEDTAPHVIGSAVSGTTVKLYTNASCSGSPVASGTAAAFASPGLQVSVAENATTSIYATATDNLGNASDCSTGISYTQDATIGIAEGLARLTQLDAFETVEVPLSGGGSWTQLAWASNLGQVAGSGTSRGWGPYNGYPVVSGAYWNPASFADAGRGVAVAGTLAVGAELANRWFSVWLDMSSPGSTQSGYELRFTYSGEEEEEDLYDVTLSKWTSGTRTVLASTSEFTLAPESSFALVDKGGTVYAWTDAGSGYRLSLSASDTAYSRGYAGINGAGNIARVRGFRAGAL